MKKYRIISLFAAVMVASITALPAIAAEQTDNTNETNEKVICIGSVSKMFAATAVMQLAEQGKVDIDAPVTDYLPDFYMADSRYKDITVRMLMNHTSGIMGTTAGDFLLLDDRDAQPHDTLLKELNSQRLKANPGDFGAYCNDGFTLLELIVENVTDMTFTEYVEANICKPLDMQQTGSAWNMFRADNMVETFIGGNVRFALDYCMDIGSGGIFSTAEELTRFGSTFFKGDNTLLSEQSKKEMASTAVTDKYEEGFGLGWDSVNYADYEKAGVQVVSKGGDVFGQHASLVIAPDEEISVSVLSSGGSSSGNRIMAMKLMDIALAEKGITIEHPEPQPMETLDSVPEKYLSYADTYVTSMGMCVVSFPDQKYMEITAFYGDKPETKQYLYTTEDNFVLMDGSIESGRAVQSKNQSLLHFTKRNGIDYICSDDSYEFGGSGNMEISSYAAQRAEKVNISDDLQAAWDARNGKKYYFYSGKYSNAYYSELPSIKFNINSEIRGYVDNYKIIDNNHLEAALVMPGGRDLQDIEMRMENGTEILDITNCAIEFISEDAIEMLPDDLTEIQLHTKQATWFRIKDTGSRTINLDMPENSAVYVYDAYDRMIYSSYMTEYGNAVTLPENGKIVFIGEDGGTIKIN